MIRVWLLLNYPERTAERAKKKKKRCVVATRTLDSCPRIAEAALPNMSSQAKVKKDKEIIAEYETQVKGW